MKPYGVPRTLDLENPDCADILFYGCKSSVGRPVEKGGDFKNSRRNASSKRNTRRAWKKKARREGLSHCRNYLKYPDTEEDND